MIRFLKDDTAIESSWRAIVLFGSNTTSYKFALAQTLLQLAGQKKTTVGIEELAEPFGLAVCEHLRSAPRQGTNERNSFLDACRRHNAQELSLEELVAETIKHGFNYVLDRFQIVNGEPIPLKFYEDEVRTNRRLVLTDSILTLPEGPQFLNLPSEVQSRWRLVETAWQLGIGRGMLAVTHDIPTEEFFVQTPSRRIGLTSSRGALNGYQKGRCFYCFREICVVTSDRLPDVDHFYPLTLAQVDSALTPILNGIWNLVLACRSCNRGTDGKMTRVPDLQYRERLHRRNSFLINSHHPLRDTLMQQTGATEAARAQFLRKMDTNAIKMLIHRWSPPDELPPAF